MRYKHVELKRFIGGQRIYYKDVCIYVMVVSRI